MVVNRGVVQGVVLHARAHTAGEGVRVLEGLEATHGQREEIGHPPVFGVLGRQDVVQQAPFVIIHRPWGGVDPEKQVGQLEHVVHIAGLCGLGAQAHAELVGLPKVLVVGVPPGHIAVVVDYPVPEKRGGPVIGAVSGYEEPLGQADELRELGVAVQPGQGIVPGLQGPQHGLVVKAARQGEVAPFAGIGVQVCQYLIHPAVFAVQYLLHLAVVEARQDLFDPVRKMARHLQGLGVAPKPVGIAKAGQHLVVGVERRPDPIQVEALGADIAPGYLVFKDAFPVVKSPDIPLPVGLLAGGQFGNDIIGPVAEFLVSRTLVEQVAGREVMPEAVPGQGFPFPPPVGFGFGLQAGLDPEAGQQAVWLIGQHGFFIELAGMKERPFEEADLVQGKSRDAPGRFGLPFRTATGSQQGKGT